MRRWVARPGKRRQAAHRTGAAMKKRRFWRHSPPVLSTSHHPKYVLIVTLDEAVETWLETAADGRPWNGCSWSRPKVIPSALQPLLALRPELNRPN